MSTPKYFPDRRDISKHYVNADSIYGSGNFGYITDVAPGTQLERSGYKQYLSFFGCRDSFQSLDSKIILDLGFTFTHDKSLGFDFACFMAKIEDLLEITPSIYQVTSNPSVTWVYPSRWWFSMPMRRSFYSMALKSSLNYRRQGDFLEFLYKNTYAAYTPKAVRKFLAGCTVYEYTPESLGDGWLKQFTIQTKYNSKINYTENQNAVNRMRPGYEMTVKRAYEIWCQKGRRLGNDYNDYCEAEQQLIKEAS